MSVSSSGTALRRICLGAATTLVLAFAISACGGDSGSEGSDQPVEATKATLVLDYLPNGVHAGIYHALAAGYYEDEGIDLKVITPTSTADTLRLIEAGKADFGLADSLDIATQIDNGLGAKGIMAITQRPNGGLVTLADEDIVDPAGLEGKTVGVTGVPSDKAVFETMVKDAGGDPSKSKVVTIGFNGVQALQAGKISAFTGYVAADATAIQNAGQKTRSFAFDEFGGPASPGLVAFSTESRIKEDPDLMDGFVAATVKGYQDALADPGQAVSDLVEAGNGIDSDLALKTFEAYEPLIGETGKVGTFDADSLTGLSDFMVERDLIAEPIPPDRFATIDR